MLLLLVVVVVCARRLDRPGGRRQRLRNHDFIYIYTCIHITWGFLLCSHIIWGLRDKDSESRFHIHTYIHGLLYGGFYFVHVMKVYSEDFFANCRPRRRAAGAQAGGSYTWVKSYVCVYIYIYIYTCIIVYKYIYIYIYIYIMYI